jgi:uncharacterized protein YuzE
MSDHARLARCEGWLLGALANLDPAEMVELGKNLADFVDHECTRTEYISGIGVSNDGGDMDVMYITMPPLEGHDGKVARSERVSDDAVLDFDTHDRLVGIELLQTYRKKT